MSAAPDPAAPPGAAGVPPAAAGWRGVAAEPEPDEPRGRAFLLLDRSGRSRRLLGALLRPHRAAIALLVVLIVVSAAAGLAIPYLVKVGIDAGIPPLVAGHAPATLLAAVGGVLGAALLQGLTRQAFLRLSGRVGQDILLELRRRVFTHFQRLSPAFHERYTSGRVIARLTSDVEAISEMLGSGFDRVVTAVLTLAGTAAMLLVLDARLALVALLPLPVLVLLTLWYRRESAAAYRRTRETVALLIVHFVESMTGIRAVQAFRREERNQEIFERLNADFRRTPASVDTRMTAIDMANYLDYCSEMLSLVGKAAALFGDRTTDSAVLDTVSDVESLTDNMSTKIWQKVALLPLDDSWRRPGPIPGPAS